MRICKGGEHSRNGREGCIARSRCECYIHHTTTWVFKSSLRREGSREVERAETERFLFSLSLSLRLSRLSQPHLVHLCVLLLFARYWNIFELTDERCACWPRCYPVAFVHVTHTREHPRYSYTVYMCIGRYNFLHASYRPMSILEGRWEAYSKRAQKVVKEKDRERTVE